MSIVDAFFDPDAPDDPLAYVEDSAGGLFVPMTGLTFEHDEVEVGGLRFVRLPARTWPMIEKSWLVDLYREFYAAAPKRYCVIPVDSADAMQADVDGYLERVLAPLAELLLAMRMSTAGFAVDPRHAVPVLRIAGMNHRPISPDRYRLYGTAFGDDVALGPKSRQLGDSAISYPERVVPSSGAALALDDELLPVVERHLRLLRAYRASPPNAAVEIALDQLTRGHDVFVTVREQLFALVTALEAVFGGFRRGRKAAGLEPRVAEAASIFRGDAGDLERRLAGEVRRVRNAIAHGADYSRDLPYGEAAELLRAALRIGLPPLLLLASPAGAQASTVAREAGEDEDPTPPVALQRLLDRASARDLEARRALEDVAGKL